MNKKGNMFVQTISLYIPNTRTLTHHNLPLSIQSKKISYNEDKLAAVFGFQRIVWFLSLSSVAICNNKIIDLTVHLALRAPLKGGVAQFSIF